MTSAIESQMSCRAASTESTRTIVMSPIDVSRIAIAGNTSSRRSPGGRATTQASARIASAISSQNGPSPGGGTSTNANAPMISAPNIGAAARPTPRTSANNMEWYERLVEERNDDDHSKHDERGPKRAGNTAPCGELRTERNRNREIAADDHRRTVLVSAHLEQRQDAVDDFRGAAGRACRKLQLILRERLVNAITAQDQSIVVAELKIRNRRFKGGLGTERARQETVQTRPGSDGHLSTAADFGHDRVVFREQ